MQLPLSHTPCRAVGEEELEEDSRFHPQSLDSLLDEDVEDDDDDLEEEEKICSVSFVKLVFNLPIFNMVRWMLAALSPPHTTSYS